MLKRDIAKIAQQQLNSMSGQNPNRDKYVPMPKGNSGVIIVRILPAKNEDELPWVATRIHKINDRYFHCPREQDVQGYWKGICPICDKYQALWKLVDAAKTEDEAIKRKDIARSLKPRLRVFYNAIIRNLMDEKTGESLKDVGPRILSNGEKLHTKVLLEYAGDRSIEQDPKAIDDLETGCDLKIIMKKIAGYANYDNSQFLSPSPAGTKAQVKAWMDNLWDLSAERKIVSLDELQEQVDIFEGLKKDESIAFEPETPKETSKEVSSEKKVVDKKVISQEETTSDDDDDIDMSLIGDDFMEGINEILKSKD